MAMREVYFVEAGNEVPLAEELGRRLENVGNKWTLEQFERGHNHYGPGYVWYID